MGESPQRNRSEKWKAIAATAGGAVAILAGQALEVATIAHLTPHFPPAAVFPATVGLHTLGFSLMTSGITDLRPKTQFGFWKSLGNTTLALGLQALIFTMVAGSAALPYFTNPTSAPQLLVPYFLGDSILALATAGYSRIRRQKSQ